MNELDGLKNFGPEAFVMKNENLNDDQKDTVLNQQRIEP